MTVPYYAVGNTHAFDFFLQKDAAVWVLTTAQVYFVLIDPSRVEYSHSATVVSASTGEAKYVTTTTDLSVQGTWRYYWRVVDGSVDLASEPILFYVSAR